MTRWHFYALAVQAVHKQEGHTRTTQLKQRLLNRGGKILWIWQCGLPFWWCWRLFTTLLLLLLLLLFGVCIRSLRCCLLQPACQLRLCLTHLLHCRRIEQCHMLQYSFHHDNT